MKNGTNTGPPIPLQQRVRFQVSRIEATNPEVVQKPLRSFDDLDQAKGYARDYAAKHHAHTSIDRRTYRGRKLISVDTDIAVF